MNVVFIYKDFYLNPGSSIFIIFSSDCEITVLPLALCKRHCSFFNPITKLGLVGRQLLPQKKLVDRPL